MPATDGRARNADRNSPMTLSPMTPRLVIVLSLLAVLMSVTAGAAEQKACPIEPFDLAAVEQLMSRAPGCDAAMTIFNRCGVGTSADLHTGDIATKKCEAAFAGRLSPAQTRAYARARHVCATKYAHESGTMYRSFEAYCVAQAAQRLALQVTRATAGR